MRSSSPALLFVPRAFSPADFVDGEDAPEPPCFLDWRIFSRVNSARARSPTSRIPVMGGRTPLSYGQIYFPRKKAPSSPSVFPPPPHPPPLFFQIAKTKEAPPPFLQVGLGRSLASAPGGPATTFLVPLPHCPLLTAREIRPSPNLSQGSLSLTIEIFFSV